MKNSVIIVSVTVVIAMALAFLAAVALAKYRFTGRKLFIVLMIGVQMLPAAGLIIPLYVLLARYHQVNTLTGVIPFSVWTLRGFILGIPKDLEEAAMVDGSTRLGAFVRILVRDAGVGAGDAFVAVSASGETPFTTACSAALASVESLAQTTATVSAPASFAAESAAFVGDVGPELVAGSTRLKAGTAQKLVLNAISTVAMIRLGRTYAGLMVGVAPDNDKLCERARRNVVIAGGAPEHEVDAALAAAGGDALIALVTLLAGVDAPTARARLEHARGSVRQALGSST